MILVTKPFFWVSAHREIVFRFNYIYHYTVQVVYNQDGNAMFQFADDGIHYQSVGDYIWIDSGIYKGYHRIISIPVPFIYETSSPYIGTATGAQLWYVENSLFTIYSGYSSGFLSSLLPYTLIATFRPEPNLDGELIVDVSGYVNKIFDTLNSNLHTDFFGYDVYYNLFNHIDVLVNGVVVSSHAVLNASITSLELNRDYVGTGRGLNDGSLGPHYFDCGENLNLVLGSLYVFDSTPLSGAVNPDFDPTYFNATDFSTVI